MATSPTISYVGSVDTTNSPNGSNMFKILFDPNIQPLMFEYQIMPDTTELVPPEDIITGFINPDTAQSEGISNQYQLPIPSTGNDYNTGKVIRIRVYPQLLSVTPWSNALNFYNPPAAPGIIAAKYDSNTPVYYQDDDDLWVLLQGPKLEGIQYIIAYYFCDSDDNTVWKVSDPLEPEVVMYGGNESLRIHTSMDDDVSKTEGKNVVYVAVHAVFGFQDPEGKNFYTVSEISQSVKAEQSTFEAPTLHPIDYNSVNQSVTLTWDPPNSSYLPFYSVSAYDIYLSVSGGGASLLDTVSGTENTFNYTNDITTCGSMLEYYVVANSATGAAPLQSNTESVQVFYAATQPLDLNYEWAVPLNDNTTTVKVGFTFKNPSYLGCGSDPLMNWQIYDTTNESVVTEGTAVYNDAMNHIYAELVDFSYSDNNQYVIRAFVSTIDPNSQTRINGGVAQSSVIVPENVPIIYNISQSAAGVSFNVTSQLLISPTAQFIHVIPGGIITNIKFDTTDFDFEQTGDVEVYTCLLSWVDLGISPTNNFTIAVGNSAGVGVGHYNNAPQ